ncbi:hypothetical protein IAR55_003291 [Kwoniella newhampshirensis]|uniref:Uncharacterized protein n=1 Tax=Kwoniella newhampshirensis TaxID=1651941 RepID=A0AAW0YM30_9TREE
MSTASRGAYVPPHLRNRTGLSSPSASSSSSPDGESNSSRAYKSAPTRSTHSRTPWSLPTQPLSSSDGSSSFSNKPSSYPSKRSASTNGHAQRTSHGRIGGGPASSPSLYIFGDSFVGPMKLLSDECVQIKTFKGSSAKGLNNPKSIKQVSKELVPILDHLLAPPPYAYVPSSGRWALLVFGNVDLQINYLWQLANKPLTEASIPSMFPGEKYNSNNDGEEGDSYEVNDRQSTDDSPTPLNVLATATETSVKGPALGPELFVKVVVDAYTSWLEREIINGPVGKRLAEGAEQRRNESSTTSSSIPLRRRPPPSKVLIAAALPPLIEDEMLPRIPEKYVDRLEEDHEKAQRALDRTSGEGRSRTPWAAKGTQSKEMSETDDHIEVGLSTLSVSDEPVPPSPVSLSSVSSDVSITVESHPSVETSTHSMTTAVSSTPTSAGNTKTPITDLLIHSPPLCTLPVRVQMTNNYNAALKSFCEKFPDVLGFVDISESMHTGSEAPSVHGEVDRNVWACPVDPTNVHPLWEPTLPLWMKALGEQGVPTSEWRISEDAEETFRAYEIDKRRRTEKRKGGSGEEGVEERIKLRDE